ncbi:MAG: YdeI/OmpD-associated family protein [Chloroflexi bacterium]|nr:YdeI/OmpD-associated family protein [Chloroflexota bacterium]MCL5275332.1 YdeI/OmpD-associated family protein [Chloroflexota bacterium]
MIVRCSPEGPQQTTLAEDIAAALAAEPEARAFFDSPAAFYRRTYLKWIEGAIRPETRAARIAEMAALLKACKKQK